VQAYDYHPVIQLSDQEAPEKSLGDCAICMDAIHVERAEDAKGGVGVGAGRLLDRVSGSANVGGKVRGRSKARGNKSYSLAPCHHLFVSKTVIPYLFLWSGPRSHSADSTRIV
jgi:hypothetical protein